MPSHATSAVIPVAAVFTPFRPANQTRLESPTHLPNRPRHAPQTDKTTPKLTKTVHPKRTISRKTLGFLRIRPDQENFAEKLSTRSPEHPNATAERPHSAMIMPERNRTESNRTEQPDLNRAEPGWSRLNKPDHPERPIPRKTLEIVSRTPKRKNSAEQLNTAQPRWFGPDANRPYSASITACANSSVLAVPP